MIPRIFQEARHLEFLKAGKEVMTVNGKCVSESSYRCKEADIISVRGYGRLFLSREWATNKGRMKVHKLYMDKLRGYR